MTLKSIKGEEKMDAYLTCSSEHVEYDATIRR